MKKLFKFTGGFLMAFAFFFVLGTAGADCDGKCMENSLTLSEIAINLTIASFAGWVGFLMYKYGDDYLG